MTFNQKVIIAAAARTLITALLDCDDEEFVNLVTECVASGDETPLEVENL